MNRFTTTTMATAVLFVILQGGLASPDARGAMDIRGYPTDPSLYSRFDGSNADFIGASENLSGVGMDGTHYATMISPNFFLSANHYHPATGATLTFYGDNSPSGTAVTASIAGGQRIGTTDLWLGWLTAPLLSTITYYPVHEALGQSFVGNEVWAMGKDAAADPTQDQRLGRNIVDGVGTLDQLFVNGAVDDDHLAVFGYHDYAAGETDRGHDIGGDEFRYVSGDSGGPTFILLNGTFSLFGINYFIYDPAINLVPYPQVHDQTMRGSGVTRVPGYIDAINAAMAAQDTTDRQDRLSLVPEPSAILLFIAAWAGMACRRRRRHH